MPKLPKMVPGLDIAGDILAGLVPVIIDLVQRGLRGEDVTNDEVMKRLSPELQTVLRTRLKREARRLKGLPV